MRSDAGLHVTPPKLQGFHKAIPNGTTHGLWGATFGPLLFKPPFRFPLRRGPHFRSSGRGRSPHEYLPPQTHITTIFFGCPLTKSDGIPPECQWVNMPGEESSFREGEKQKSFTRFTESGRLL